MAVLWRRNSRTAVSVLKVSEINRTIWGRGQDQGQGMWGIGFSGAGVRRAGVRVRRPRSRRPLLPCQPGSSARRP